MSLKLNLTCSICFKIYRDPVCVPCGHTYCREHIFNGDTLFECFPCGKQFDQYDSNNEFNDEFPTNIVVSNQIRDENYLSLDEKKAKKDLDDAITLYKHKRDEYEEDKRAFDAEIHIYFNQIRAQINTHRLNECFNEKSKHIDIIAYGMIDQLREFEISYLFAINSKLNMHEQYATLAIDYAQKTHIINDLFRETNATIDDEVKQLQVIQEKCINEVKSSQEEMRKMREHLKTNRFIANDAADDTFGELILNEYKCSFSDSLILSQQQSFDLIKLCQFSFEHKWSLVYRATRDGFRSKNFHKMCDHHANTLTIIKSKSYIFGGYTDMIWQDKRSKSIKDTHAFVFSLTNVNDEPCKLRVNKEWSYMSIDCDGLNGPSFGINDIHIGDEANKSACSFSDLGFAYTHPLYEHKTNEARSFLAGSFKFQVDDIEVYQKEEEE